MDFNQPVIIDGHTFTLRQVLVVVLPHIKQILGEWTGNSLESYIKFKLGQRTSQYENKTDDVKA